MTQGPHAGPEPTVRYCPECKSDLVPEQSNQQPPARSHRYRCQGCGRLFEINKLPESAELPRSDRVTRV